jgi:hypothetical protein
MKLVIDRKLWLRGEGSDCSSLLRDKDRKMCCLGFLCLANGLSEQDIIDIQTPGNLSERRREPLPGTLRWLIDENGDSKDCAELMRFNDAKMAWDYHSSTVNLEDCREFEIARVFRNHDIEVEFVN